MKNRMLENVDQIKSWFAPSPYLPGGLLDPVFDLVEHQEPDRFVIEIKQFIFTRARIVFPHNEQNAWLTTVGGCDLGGDLQSLRNALINDGYIKSVQETMTQLFTRAAKPKPNRKGIRLSRNKRRA